MSENKETGLQITAPNSLISQTEIEFANKVNDILVITRQIATQTNPIIKGLIQANAMEQINSLITPELMKPVEKLFGTSLGIKTDKVYQPETMKRIFIEATLGGWGIVGNQVNVLGGNLYITAKGYLPRLREYPGLKFKFPFKHQLPVQDATHGTWSVTSEIEYELNGVKHKAIITNPTKKNEGQSSDALWGKADTKCARWLWNTITGEDTMDDSGSSEFSEVEVVSSSENKGEGEKVNVASAPSEGIKKVSEDFQSKFDSYISKAVSIEDLVKRATVWCDSPQAKSAGVNMDNLDLKTYQEISNKFG